MLATGGTGGHIYPALAVAEVLAARGLEPVFVGQKTGLEAQLVPAAGLPFYGVRAGKWHRGRPDPRQAALAALGLRDALKLLRQLRPALVVGFGGFASFPALAAARTLGVPYALHEQNAFPGKVTRWFAGGARFVAAAAGEVNAHLPVKAEVVGLPIRETRVPKGEARRRLGLPEEGVVTFVMGGSQGSATLNRAVPEAFAKLAAELPSGAGDNLYVLHSSGPAHLGATRARATETHTATYSPTYAKAHYRVDAYVESVLAWSAADLGVTRSGNGTLAEAAFYGVPLVMVPLPTAAEDHQLRNAEAVAAAGAGVVVEEKALRTLPNVWAGLLEPATRHKMSAQARLRSPAGAAERLATLIERTLHTGAVGATGASNVRASEKEREPEDRTLKETPRETMAAKLLEHDVAEREARRNERRQGLRGNEQTMQETT